MSAQPTPTSLLEYLKALEKPVLAALATNAKTSEGNLWQIAYGHGHCSPAMARNIAAACGWKVTPHVIAPVHYPFPNDGVPPEHRTAA